MGALLVAGQRLRFDIKTILVLVGINLAIGFVVEASTGARIWAGSSLALLWRR